ncbi:alpha/beta hydrolase [Clostridium paraputrificum]|uniref:alpha/beta hydrolase n=1 Tax=Clostridium paraputrificum TaxID=29363 RepID=UPI00232F7CD5|nr:alpha/beta fold hydrolase [Clostridium paraputrificum]MDB2107226.1 alpha/beta hydrolase [Clostridium paraputrificum]MDB2113783.1 alpha/beta hydrolase [Clostridium paraputrificum]
MSYNNQKSWKEIQSFLPQNLHFTSTYKPDEEWWNWKGNKVHLDTFRNKNAKAKVILFHGVGTNGRQMSTIIGGPLSKDGFEVIAIDMPLYGVTEVNKNMTITYDDWVNLGNDYINYELSRDSRPIFLYGLSAGGMETYHVACKNKKVKGIIGMTFLDQRDQEVRDETTKNIFWAKLGVPLSKLSSNIGLSKFKMKMTICSKMNTLCNDKNALKVMIKVKTSAGSSVPLKFIYTYMTYSPDIEAKNFDICPILLTQPEEDRWTPLHLSIKFLNKIKKVPVKIVKLEKGSHYPIEEPALEQLHLNILQFINEYLN